MTIGFIPPTLEVLEDQRVTTSELSWLTQELTMVIIVAVMMTTVMKITETAIEGR